MKNLKTNYLSHKNGGIWKSAMLCCFIFATTLTCRAQLVPFQSMYYQNRYLANPAMAGIDKGVNLELDYRKQWSEFPGMPQTSSFTADYGTDRKVGIGFWINDDQAGLIRSTRFEGSYAYHLPLNEQDERLSFGVSCGINDSRIDMSLVNGDLSDQSIAAYNQLKPYFDGDIGVAYTSSRWYIGAALPNIRSTLFNTSGNIYNADLALFSAIASYKIPVQGDGATFMLEPLAAYRVVKGYNDIVDCGFNFVMGSYYGLYLQAIYHSSKTLGAGFGLDHRNYVLNFSYNMETGALSNFTNGAFEVGLRLKLREKRSVGNN
ncbi:MAG: PorP/SprF family type IX secretion system membrane protein [Bacteroidetes bacterium]|nr:PorP/SprF family type IX secretion system membrane protein [Bacteroidota bacterium]